MNLMLRLLQARQDYQQASGQFATSARVGSAVAAELRRCVDESIRNNERYIHPTPAPAGWYVCGLDVCEDATLPPDAIVVDAPERPKA